MASSSDGWGDWGQEIDLSAATAAGAPKMVPDTPPQAPQPELSRTPKSRSRNPSGDTPKLGASGKLEALSKDDLVKFVKRQMVLLQRSKVKCDELSKEVAALKTSPPLADLKALQDELNEVQEERDNAISGYTQAQQAQEATANQIKTFEDEISKVTKENKGLREQVECMTMKDETMTSSFIALQAELDKSERDKKAIEKEIEVQKEARDQALTALHDLKGQTANSATSADAMKVELEDQRVQCSQLKEIVKALQTEKSQIKSEHESLIASSKANDAKINELLEQLNVSSSQCQQLTGDLEQSQQSYADLENQLEKLGTKLRKEREKFKTSESNLSAQLAQLKLEREADEQASQEQVTQFKELLRAAHNQVELLQKQHTKTQHDLLASTTATVQVEELSKEIAQLRSESEQLVAQLAEATEKLLTSRTSEERVRKEMQDMGVQLESLGRECAELRSECEEGSRREEQLRAEVDKYVKTTELLSQKLTQEEAGSKASGDNEKETSAQVEQLQGELEAAHEQLRAATEKLSDWESLMTMLKNDRDRLESDKQKLISLEERESTSMTELDDLNSSLTEALQERDTLRDQMCRLTERGGITASINTLKQTLEDLKFERDELNEKMSSIQEQNEQLTKDTELLNSENENQAMELQALKEKERQMMENNGQIEAECRKLLIEKDTLLNELTERDSGAASSALELADVRAKVQNFDAEHEKMLVEVEEFRRQSEIAQEKLLKVQKELAESRRQIESFLPEREMLEQKLADLSAVRRQAGVIHEENDRLKIQLTNLTEARNELTEVKDQHELLKQEFATQQENVEHLQKQLQTVEEQKQTITQEVKLLRNDIDAASERTKNIETEKKQISKAMEDLRCDLESKSQTAQSLEKELYGVKLNLETVEQQYKEAVNSQADKDTIVTEKVQQLESSISEKCTRQKELEVQLAEANEMISSLQMQLQNKDSDLDITRKKCNKFNQQCSQLESDLEESRFACKGLETSSSDLNAKLKASEGKLNDLGEKNVAVCGELKQLKDLIESMKQGSDTTAQEVTTVKQELAKLQGQKAGLEEQLLVLETERVQLVEQFHQATQAISHLKIDKSQVEEELEMFKKQHREAMEETIKAEAEQASKVHEVMQVRQALEVKVVDLEAKVQQGTNQLSAIKTELEQLKSNDDQLQLKLQEEVSERNSLRDQLSAAESERASLLSNLHKSTGEITELQQKLHQASQRVASLEGHVQDMKTSTAALEKQLAEMKDNYEKKVLEENKLKEELSSKVRDLDEACQEVSGKEAELSELRQSARTAEAAQQSTVTQDDQQITKLQKELKEANDKMNKFKQLALKAKKESNDLKSRLDKISSELECAQRERAEVALNCQQLQAALDQSDVVAEEANTSIQKKTEEVEALQKEQADFKERLQAADGECEELKGQIAEADRQREEIDGERVKVGLELEAVRIQRDQFMKDKLQLETEVTQLQEEMKCSESEHGAMVKTLQAELGGLQSKLSNAQKEAQQSSMMDLEIADYERTVQTLNEQMTERDAKIKNTQAEVTRQEEKVTALMKQLESSEAQSLAAEERANKLKQLLVKSKKDLGDAKKAESEQRAADAHLQGRLEMLNQQAEEQKIQIAGLVAENAKLVSKMRGSTDSNQRSVRSLELKVASLQGDLDLTKTELDSVQTEYDSYKIRVHNVLKQQKERGPNDGAQQMDKQERERFEDVIDQLKSKVADLSQQLSSTLLDSEVLQEEHDRLQARHTRLLQDLTEKESAWKARLDQVTADRSAFYIEHDETVHQLTLQNDALTQTFKDQIRLMQEEHQRVVDALQVQVERVTSEAMSARPDTPTAKSPIHAESDPDMDGNHRGPLRTEERQAAEGMELPEPEACKRTLMISPQSLVPLEQLLNSPPTSPVPMSLDMLDESLLRIKLATAQQRIEHLSGLMNESEATVLRLTEQARVLKEEIRRQERNMERNQHVEKAEYLKNIILKFLTLETEDERKQLIPVLVTMLRLSPDEKNTLMFIARGGKEDAEKDAAGWSGYLHRWSGLI